MPVWCLCCSLTRMRRMERKKSTCCSRSEPPGGDVTAPCCVGLFHWFTAFSWILIITVQSFTLKTFNIWSFHVLLIYCFHVKFRLGGTLIPTSKLQRLMILNTNHSGNEDFIYSALQFCPLSLLKIFPCEVIQLSLMFPFSSWSCSFCFSWNNKRN